MQEKSKKEEWITHEIGDTRAGHTKEYTSQCPFCQVVQEKSCEKCLGEKLTCGSGPVQKFWLKPDCDCHKVQEKSVVERFREKFGIVFNIGVVPDDKTRENIEQFISDLQKETEKHYLFAQIEAIEFAKKETDDKWKKKIEEIITKLDKRKSGYLQKILYKLEGSAEWNAGYEEALDQATNIIKEMVK